MVKSGFSGFQVLLGGDHVSVKLWCEVVHGVGSFVVALVFITVPVPFFSGDLFSNTNVDERVLDVSIHTEGWNTVVHWPGGDL